MKQCFWNEHKEREHLKDVTCEMETLKFILYGKYMYLYTGSIWNNHFYTGIYIFCPKKKLQYPTCQMTNHSQLNIVPFLMWV